MMYGREPVDHLFPFRNCLPKVDISDPHTFLAIKRGILQYTWLKPVLGFTSLIMKATGIYKEGYLGLDSGYLWSGIAYNLSVTISLYSLGLFWVCMSKDLQPFRPVPKFLCIKLIIFASYWQGFFLSILVWSGAIPDNFEGYSSDNLAMAIQDALICIEMPILLLAIDSTISAARMPIKYALRDALGIRDLIEDTKETFSGNKYKYRFFESGDNILAHEGSSSRVARMMEGMRYERSGRRKYWIPKPGEVNVKTPLLFNDNASFRSQSRYHSSRAISSSSQYSPQDNCDTEDQLTDSEEESLYNKARTLEYGDWNYPVITVQEVTLDRQLNTSPRTVTTSKNRHLLYRTGQSGAQRIDNTNNVVKVINPKHTSDSWESRQIKKKDIRISKLRSFSDKVPNEVIASKGILHSHSSSSSSSTKSDQPQTVDLIVEDTVAEDMLKVRAKKEGSAGWNTVESKRFMRTYGKDTEEDISEGLESSSENNLTKKFQINQDTISQSHSNQNNDIDCSEESQKWGEEIPPLFQLKPKYGITGEAFENVWTGFEPSELPKENP
ncbi:hypothetical protein EPUL_001422 [Erysiphe pulchra]|uniref:DUF300-domain-containing protein n=1 Tax=Erysiphe pulchra TaxID=225359 RepID=A0A2S4PY20_9PEZI|nr:hypothetical protein EPUL_001422 [Erysiphe pulchra]